MKSCDTSSNKKIVICISGMTGSGKSTVAKKIAEKYGLDYYSGGNAMRVLAQEEGYNSEVTGWWESAEGLKFLQQRMNNPAFDKKIDDMLLEYGKKGNVVLDSWTMPWLLDEGFKVWLEASPKVRAQRVVTRDGLSTEDAMAALVEKDAQTRKIYKNLYGFDLGLDLSPFNLILTTDDLEPEEVYYAVALVTDRLVFGKK
ncbi:MAG: cytidylate kinase family protein [Candidatus Bathyarchaeia archaeon]